MKNVLIFCLGAAVGAAAAYIFTKKTYEELVRVEVESVKEAYRDRAGTDIPEGDDSGAAQTHFSDKPDDLMDYYKKTIKDNGYAGADKAADIPEAAHIITPDSYGELDYERISLNYWADKVLTDEDDEIIEDPEKLIGSKALDSFGEEDAVYVRNDELRVDYEILLDIRTFSEYQKKAAK